MNTNDKIPMELTNEQKEVLLGNLLGDGSLTRLVNENRNSRFSITQSAKKREYIDGLYSLWQPFGRVETGKTRKPKRVAGRVSHKIEDWGGGYSYRLVFRTPHHPVFTDLRRKWYEDPCGRGSKKIIPQDLKLTWRIAAIWMCDDGSTRSNSRRVQLATNSFSVQDVDFLVAIIKHDLGITAKRYLTKKGQPFIEMYSDEAIKWLHGIKPHIPWKCLQYKTRYAVAKSKSGRVNTSGTVGVDFSKGGWRARGTLHGKAVDLGRFRTEQEAIAAKEKFDHDKELGIAVIPPPKGRPKTLSDFHREAISKGNKKAFQEGRRKCLLTKENRSKGGLASVKAQQDNYVHYEWNDGKHTLPELAKAAGLNYTTVWNRLKRGWSLEKALGK